MTNLRDIKNKKQEKITLETYKGGVVAETWLKNLDNCNKLTEELNDFYDYSKIVSEEIHVFINENILNLQQAIVQKNKEKILENLNLLSSFFNSLTAKETITENTVPSLLLCEEEKVKKLLEIIGNLTANKKQSLNEMAPSIPKFFLEEKEMEQLILESGMFLNEGLEELKQMIDGLEKLETVVKAMPGFETTKAELAKFKTSIQNTASSRFGVSFSEETQIARISLVMEMFAKFSEAWPTVRKLFEKELSDASGTFGQNNVKTGGFVSQADEEDKEEKLKELTANATKALIKAIKGSWFTRMSRVWKAAKKGSLANILKVTYPGKLNPETLMQDLVKVLMAKPTVVNKTPRTQIKHNVSTPSTSPAITTPSVTQTVTEGNLNETLSDVDRAMSSLTNTINALNTQAQQAVKQTVEEPQQGTEPQTEQQPVQQQTPAQTQTPEPAQPGVEFPVSDEDKKKYSDDQLNILKKPVDPKTTNQVLAAVKKFKIGALSAAQITALLKTLDV